MGKNPNPAFLQLCVKAQRESSVSFASGSMAGLELAAFVAVAQSECGHQAPVGR